MDLEKVYGMDLIERYRRGDFVYGECPECGEEVRIIIEPLGIGCTNCEYHEYAFE